MAADFAYDYNELINRSDEINFFAEHFDKHLINLAELAKIISRNISSDQAAETIKTLGLINNKSSDIQQALINFATSIREEIAPAYETIQKNAKNKTESVYG